MDELMYPEIMTHPEILVGGHYMECLWEMKIIQSNATLSLFELYDAYILLAYGQPLCNLN